MASPDPLGSPKLDLLCASPVGVGAPVLTGASPADGKTALSMRIGSAADSPFNAGSSAAAAGADFKLDDAGADAKSVTSLGITWTTLNPSLTIPEMTKETVASLADVVAKKYATLSKGFSDAKTLRQDIDISDASSRRYTICVSRQMVLLDTGEQVGTDIARPSTFKRMIDLVHGQRVVLINPGLERPRFELQRALDDWRVRRELMLSWGNGDPNFPVTLGLFPLCRKSTGDDLRDFGVVQIEYNGSLGDLLDAGELTNSAEKALLFTCAIQTLHTVHQRGWVHRDVKIDNYLCEKIYDKLVALRLTDFEMAANGKKEHSLRRGRACGTFFYFAPELCRLYSGGKITPPSLEFLQAAEIWSLGVVLHQLIIGDIPPCLEEADASIDRGEPVSKLFTCIGALCDDHSDARQAHEKVLAKYKKSQSVHENVIAECLQADPKKRPTTGKILEMLGKMIGDSPAEDGLSPADQKTEKATFAAATAMGSAA